MDENKKPLRSAEEINADYAEVCKRLGDLHVKRLALDLAMSSLENHVKSLDAEMGQAMAAAQAPASEPQAVAEEPKKSE